MFDTIAIELASVSAYRRTPCTYTPYLQCPHQLKTLVSLHLSPLTQDIVVKTSACVATNWPGLAWLVSAMTVWSRDAIWPRLTCFHTCHWVSWWEVRTSTPVGRVLPYDRRLKPGFDVVLHCCIHPIVGIVHLSCLLASLESQDSLELLTPLRRKSSL